MSKQMMEILAPAGGPEALKAAVFAGADAVYLGGPSFGARANAKNFSYDELQEAVEFCHGRGVKVHVTVNTLLKDSELPAALEFVKYLCALPVDAVLVQDMGLFSLLRKAAPQLPLHASTQMSLHTPGGAKLLWELGAKRVVLARELSLEETREIAESCPVEVESFIHGALCMSVSGQCYFSAMLGGRSGNRGQCAQTCRLPFMAPGGTGHDLSLKDLSLIGQMDKLKEAGVCSAKIEGRMKRPEYVAAAVRACRLAADGQPVPDTLYDALRAVFSRSGFTDGYFAGKRGREMFGTRTKEDVTGATGQVLSSLRELYRGERQSIGVTFILTEEAGTLTLTASDNEGNSAQSAAESGGEDLPVLPAERCAAQLKKTGGTPFFAAEIQVPESGVHAGVSTLNALRRLVLENLLAARTQRVLIPFKTLDFVSQPRSNRPKSGPLPLRAYFRSVEQVCDEALNCEAIALPLGTDPADLQRLRDRGFGRILLELPRADFGAERQTEQTAAALMEAGFTEFIVPDLGGLWLGKKLGAVMHGGFSLNIMNSASLAFFREQGLATAELSFELAAKEADGLGDPLPRGVMVYGRQPVMLTRNCPLANAPGGCRHCQEPGYLTDRTKRRFPVLCTGRGAARYSEVFNCVPLWLGDKPHREADFGVLRFTVENAVESGRVLDACLRQETPGFEYTRGLWSRGVE